MPDELKAQMGQQKFREAHQWWLIVEVAAHRYRAWAVRWSLRKCLRARLASRGFGKTPLQVEQLAAIDRMIDEAHDMLLIEAENITTASRAAVACEMAGKIYQEEYEGLEAHILKERDHVE